MKEYVELQARKKAHELVLLIFRDAVIKKVRTKVATKLKDSISNVPAEIFEAHARFSNEEKVKYLTMARGYLQESVCYLELLKDLGKLPVKSCKTYQNKANLLDKLIVSMIKDCKKTGLNTNINYFYKLKTY